MVDTDRDTGDKRILSIDPGKSGGWFTTSFTLESTETLKHPTRENYGGGPLEYGRTGVSMDQMNKIHKAYPEITHVVIEAQRVMRGQGLASSGVTMYNYGKLVAFWESVQGSEINIHMAIPANWKKDCGLTKNKETSRRLAIEIYDDDMLWPKKKDEGVAEAAHMALWRIRRLHSFWLQRHTGVCGQQMTENSI